MRLYLLRHAEAEPYQVDDFSRSLTEKGIAQAKRVGEFLASHKILPDLILSSPVTRARETAEIVSGKLGCELTLAPWIACGMHPEVALGELAAFARLDSLIIVGHEPDLSALIAHLIGLENSLAINVTKASLTAIDLSRCAPGRGVLKLFLPVKLL
jgi:phosphohistidine phosphatase